MIVTVVFTWQDENFLKEKSFIIKNFSLRDFSSQRNKLPADMTKTNLKNIDVNE